MSNESKIEIGMLKNKIEILEKGIERTHMIFDGYGVPREYKGKEYDLNVRLNFLMEALKEATHECLSKIIKENNSK